MGTAAWDSPGNFGLRKRSMTDPFIPEAARPCPNKVLAGEAWALASRLDGVNEQDASEGVLLILAGAEDRTAQRFGASAERLGIPCAIPRSAAEVGMRMLAERDGTVSCRLSIGEEQQPVRAVLNRGLPFSDQPFVEAELMASWWAALACFPGPVINRPSRDGFLPNPDVLRLASPESGIELPPIRIATSRELAIHAPATHLRRLSDGGHAGSFAAVPEAGFDDGEVYAATRFDPSRTCQVLVAGNEFFDLSHENGCLLYT